MRELGILLLCLVYIINGVTTEIIYKPDTTIIGSDHGLPWNRRCGSDADCVSEYRQVCNKTSRFCDCPKFAFKPLESKICKNQVIVDVEASDENSLILQHFRKFRKAVALHLEISSHSMPLSSEPNSIRIFVDADVFNSTWESAALEDLMNVPEVSGAMHVNVLWNVCKYPESNPCDQNSICLVDRLRYRVGCICKFGFSSSSNHIGTVCERRRLCINGGTDSPAISACECPVFFAGDHCEVNLFRVFITITLVLIVCRMILRNLLDCRENLQHLDPEPRKVDAVSYDFVQDGQIRRRTVYSEEKTRFMSSV